VVKALSFSRFLQLKSLLIGVRQDEVKEKFTLAAFVGWQMGASPGKAFHEHLEAMGLTDKQIEARAKAPQESKGMTAKDAIAKAESILAKASKKDKT